LTEIIPSKLVLDTGRLNSGSGCVAELPPELGLDNAAPKMALDELSLEGPPLHEIGIVEGTPLEPSIKWIDTGQVGAIEATSMVDGLAQIAEVAGCESDVAEVATREHRSTADEEVEPETSEVDIGKPDILKFHPPTLGHLEAPTGVVSVNDHARWRPAPGTDFHLHPVELIRDFG